MQELRSFTQQHLAELAPLIAASSAEGYSMVQRLYDEWQSGVQTFAQPGEGFWGIWQGQRLRAIGGISIDPYQPTATLGRIRHVYVLPAWRRHGLAKQLVLHSLKHAAGHFAKISLYTNNPAAAKLYEACGFEPATGLVRSTHCYNEPD
ncbi:GNAT family N-acetyltransferase [Herpetosiphon llansteffanensis]|uniref:GNAT family N-acetyltransferase n=1 Tax=Herpetosiphon llansteffanensis TaxID=2094568 RepID=UPI000D7C5858|nr:GNAT family N-acetyltransferase [Herpetosiphon llansteffanensis]